MQEYTVRFCRGDRGDKGHSVRGIDVSTPEEFDAAVRRKDVGFIHAAPYALPLRLLPVFKTVAVTEEALVSGRNDPYPLCLSLLAGARCVRPLVLRRAKVCSADQPFTAYVGATVAGEDGSLVHVHKVGRTPLFRVFDLRRFFALLSVLPAARFAARRTMYRDEELEAAAQDGRAELARKVRGAERAEP